MKYTMAFNTPNNEVSPNSPSKIRGGAVQTAGALKVTESNVDSSNVINSGSVDAPALSGTPSYPRGGVVDTPK